jgi:dCTP deaminase
MILTRDVLLEKIKNKEVKVEPFDSKAVGPASIDLTLDTKIRIFKTDKPHLVIHEDEDYKKVTKIIDIAKNGYTLNPGELVLGITKEKITLPGNICGWLNSRSRFARLGLMSHITAPFISPGISNHQVLEIYNCANHPIKLVAGVKICQLALQECRGSAFYKGKFKDQKI